jgi:uncharacterized protein YlaI
MSTDTEINLMRFIEAREEDYVRESLKNSTLDSLADAKEATTAARKHKMRVVEHYLCDNCDKLIENPTQGFVIQGNIFVADPKKRGGLIGNNFPEPDGEGKIEIKSVKQSVFCKECFFCSLGISLEGKKSFNIDNKKNYNNYIDRHRRH